MGSPLDVSAMLPLFLPLVFASVPSSPVMEGLPALIAEDDRVLNLLHSESGPLEVDEGGRGVFRKARQRGIRVGACYRPCRLGSPPRICHYQFEMEAYVTMGDACGDCPRNKTACFDPQCITGDGYEKSVLSVNRKIPGPAIHVCRGDIVVVDVHNMMPDRITSVHWHGVLQKETPHSDGVPQVTQCGITPGSTFRYVFRATLGGTHFWHSHDGFQKMDGLLGNLVVRVPPEEDPSHSLYNADFKEHVIMITDWLHDLTDARFPGIRRRLSPEQHRPDTFLINGLGRYVDPITQMSTGTPLWSTKVFIGVRHKFRVVNGGCLVCPVRMTIERHRFTIVASDLHPVRPITVDSIIILPGERYDFVLEGPEDVSDGNSFWIHVTSAGSCRNISSPPFQLGVLHYVSRLSYSSLNQGKEPTTVVPINGFMPMNGKTVNSLQGICNTNSSEICTSSLQFMPSEVGMKVPSYSLPADQKPFRFVMPFGFHRFSKEELFNSKTFYRFFRPGVALSATINNMSMVLPPSPPLSQLDDIPQRDFCPMTKSGLSHLQFGGGGMPFMECFHLIRIPLDALVEVLIHPEGIPVTLSHPFHLHGYDFQVLRQGLLNNTSKEVISNLQGSFYSGALQDKPDSPYPPLKDTVAVPPLGYAVIRFRADNPGFWLFHCHFAFHLATGMAIVIQVGEPDDFVPTPMGFPTCGNYIPRLV